MLLKLILFLTEDFIKMIDTIILKRSDVLGKVPLTSDLVYGEVALNYKDGKLYYKNVNETIVSLNTTELAGKAPINNPTFTGIVSGITKAHIGLSAVDNTSDETKPISALTQAALDTKVNSLNANFTGTPTGITKAHIGLSAVDNTSDALKPISIATQAALDAKVSANQGQGLSDANFTAVEKSKLAGITGVNTGDQTFNLTGEVVGTGTGTIATTLSNTAVISKSLTSFSSAVGTVGTGDTIVSSIGKLDGNINALSADYNTAGVLFRIKGAAPVINTSGQYIVGQEFLPDILPVSGFTFPDASTIALPVNSVSTDTTRGLYVHDGIMAGGYPVGGRAIRGAKTFTSVAAAATYLTTSIASCKIMPQEITTGSRWFISGDVMMHGLNLLTTNVVAPTARLGIRITNLTDNVILSDQYAAFNAPTMDYVSSNVSLAYSGDIIANLFDVNYLGIAWNSISYVYSSGIQTAAVSSVSSVKGNTTAYPADGLLIEFYIAYNRNSNAAAKLSAACDLKVIHT